jgi:DNA replication protein DnaC
VEHIVPCPVCSGQRVDQRRIKAAGLPAEIKRLGDFNVDGLQGGEQALAACRKLTEDIPDFRFLTLEGNPGTGKSHLLQAVARTLLEQGIHVMYRYAPGFLDALRKSYEKDADVGYDHIFGAYADIDALFLDDLGAGRYTEWGVGEMEKLIDHRYRNRQQLLTCFATNLTMVEMAEILGYRVADRVFDTQPGVGKVVTLGGASHRTNREWQRRD